MTGLWFLFLIWWCTSSTAAAFGSFGLIAWTRNDNCAGGRGYTGGRVPRGLFDEDNEVDCVDMIRENEDQSSDRATVDRSDSASDRTRKKKTRILLLEDEEAIRTAVGQLLEDYGYDITAFPDGLSAWTSLLQSEENQFDLAICDIRMPNSEIDGLDVLRAIRRQESAGDNRYPRLAALPVILLTAKGLSQDRIDGYNAGADAYIPKPFDPSELIAVIEAVLNRRSRVVNDNSNAQEDALQKLQRELVEIKYLLVEKGGAGVGDGWISRGRGIDGSNAKKNDGSSDGTTIFLAQDERRVLELLCLGHTNKEIAKMMYLSPRRIEQLLTRMYRKVNVKNRTEMVRWAIATGRCPV
jgi:DNA-binding NarL/FixJ family response regulator